MAKLPAPGIGPDPPDEYRLFGNGEELRLLLNRKPVSEEPLKGQRHSFLSRRLAASGGSLERGERRFSLSSRFHVFHVLLLGYKIQDFRCFVKREFS